MTTLITGASGGFGRILYKTLRAEDMEAVIPVGRGTSQIEDFITCDVTDGAAVRALVRRIRPTTVFHMVGSFSNQYETDYTINAASARHLLGALVEESPETRVVLMGSAAEYGLVNPKENPINEERALRPVSIYGLTKAFQTQIAGYYAHTHGSDVVVARLFNLLAPGLSERLFVGRVERLIQNYLHGEITTIDVGNLDSQRDYISAELAIVQIRTIAASGIRGSVYHVAKGEAVVMRDLLHQMLDEAGVPRSAVREAVPDAVGRKGYDVPIIYADMRRTRALGDSAQ